MSSVLNTHATTPSFAADDHSALAADLRQPPLDDGVGRRARVELAYSTSAQMSRATVARMKCSPCPVHDTAHDALLA